MTEEHVDPFCDADPGICLYARAGRCTCPPLLLAFDRYGICKVLGEQLLQARSRPPILDALQAVIDGS